MPRNPNSVYSESLTGPPLVQRLVLDVPARRPLLAPTGVRMVEMIRPAERLVQAFPRAVYRPAVLEGSIASPLGTRHRSQR